MPGPVPLWVYMPTAGVSGSASPGATMMFFSSGYKPPRLTRASNMDVIVNQNGIFKFVYDNGPGVAKWNQFDILIDEKWNYNGGAGAATVQISNLQSLWRHIGSKTLYAPEGNYTFHWADDDMEQDFIYPKGVGDKNQYQGRVTISIEEG